MRLMLISGSIILISVVDVLQSSEVVVPIRHINCVICEHSIMVMRYVANVYMRVRFPLFAPICGTGV